MAFSIQQTARSFSGGEFETVYPHLADDVVWNVIGEGVYTGKAAVIAQCEQVSAYFKTVTTDFRTLNIIANDNAVAIDGTAEFLKDGKRLSFVCACDVYRFNDQGEVISITSYCITEK